MRALCVYNVQVIDLLLNNHSGLMKSLNWHPRIYKSMVLNTKTHSDKYKVTVKDDLKF